MPSLDFPVSAITDPLRVSGKFFRAGSEVVMVRAVTCGPFPAGAFPDEGRAQLGRIRDQLGANALRLYEIPSLEFMHACAGVGLRVFITIPWSQHVDFLSERSALAAADQLLLETVERFRGHPALGGYFVGNEIETTLVRWMGAARVVAQIERLIDLGHANDPGTLFAYANYPSTEYLLPQNQDFVAFNLYLEDRDSLSSYLARLQNLAGDKPLFISEFGADARTHGELGQAEILEWYLESAGAAGVAGSTIFAFASGSGTIRVETRLYPTISVTEFDVRLGVSGTMTEVKDTGVCCGVLVVPVASTTTPIAAGMPARVSVATFKKSNVQSQQITLTAASGSASVLSGANPAIFTTGSDAAADSLRKQFLGSCAWVLASSTSGTSRPAWLQIGSSWTTTGPTGLPAGSYVSFSDPTAVGPLLSGSTLSVYGFTHILRVDERPATLR
jgi:hypothetical protein